MKKLVIERSKALALRKKGMSYRDILAIVPVSKSTISLWLANEPLSSAEKKAVKKRRNSNIRRGRIRAASSLSARRREREEAVREESVKLFELHSQETLFFTGISLYWAEGSKRSSGFSFVNSDPDVILVMLNWIERYLCAARNTLKYRLYIHKPYAHENLEDYWSLFLGVERENFLRTIYKPTGLLVKKRPDYKGCLRIEVPKRRPLLIMKFLISLLVEYYKKRGTIR